MMMMTMTMMEICIIIINIINILIIMYIFLSCHYVVTSELIPSLMLHGFDRLMPGLAHRCNFAGVQYHTLFFQAIRKRTKCLPTLLDACHIIPRQLR